MSVRRSRLKVVPNIRRHAPVTEAREMTQSDDGDTASQTVTSISASVVKSTSSATEDRAACNSSSTDNASTAKSSLLRRFRRARPTLNAVRRGANGGVSGDGENTSHRGDCEVLSSNSADGVIIGGIDGDHNSEHCGGDFDKENLVDNDEHIADSSSAETSNNSIVNNNTDGVDDASAATILQQSGDTQVETLAKSSANVSSCDDPAAHAASIVKRFKRPAPKISAARASRTAASSAAEDRNSAGETMISDTASQSALVSCNSSDKVANGNAKVEEHNERAPTVNPVHCSDDSASCRSVAKRPRTQNDVTSLSGVVDGQNQQLSAAGERADCAMAPSMTPAVKCTAASGDGDHCHMTDGNEQLPPSTKQLSDPELYLRKRFTLSNPKRKAAVSARMNEMKSIMERVDQGKPIKHKMMMKDLILWSPSSEPSMSTTVVKDRKRSGLKSRLSSCSSEISSDVSAHSSRSVSQDSTTQTNSASSSTASVLDPDDVAACAEDDQLADDPMPVPQIKIAADGSIVVDESSLVVQTSEYKRRTAAVMSQPVIEETTDLRVSFNGYKQRRASKEWSVKETARFYKALSAVGTDFSLMLQVFPRRCRADLKRKFKREDRANPHLVAKALRADMQFDLSVFDDDWEAEVERCKKEVKKIKQEEKQLKKEQRIRDIQAKREAKSMLKRRQKKEPVCTDIKQYSAQLLQDLSSGAAPGAARLRSSRRLQQSAARKPASALFDPDDPSGQGRSSPASANSQLNVSADGQFSVDPGSLLIVAEPSTAGTPTVAVTDANCTPSHQVLHVYLVEPSGHLSSAQLPDLPVSAADLPTVCGPLDTQDALSAGHSSDHEFVETIDVDIVYEKPLNLA